MTVKAGPLQSIQLSLKQDHHRPPHAWGNQHFPETNCTPVHSYPHRPLFSSSAEHIRSTHFIGIEKSKHMQTSGDPLKKTEHATTKADGRPFHSQSVSVLPEHRPNRRDCGSPRAGSISSGPTN